MPLRRSKRRRVNVICCSGITLNCSDKHPSGSLSFVKVLLVGSSAALRIGGSFEMRELIMGSSFVKGLDFAVFPDFILTCSSSQKKLMGKHQRR